MNDLKLILISLIIGVACHYSNAGAAESYDSFVGTFTVIENIKEWDFLKIEKQDEAYLGREWSESEKKWSELFPLKNAEKILSRKQEFKGVIGFKAGMGLIVKVPVGWKYGKYTAKTGFAFVTDYPREGGADLHKINDVNNIVTP
jgi:hypothetical protein